MDLSIVFSGTQEVWRPGDGVSGVVRLTLDKPLSVQGVKVSLRGIAKSRFGLQEFESMYSTEAILFDQTTHLVESPTTLRPDTYQWDFKFVFPEKTRGYDSPFREPSRLYTDDPSHRLPPSFTISRKDKNSPYDECSVVYGLSASVDRGKSRSNLFNRNGDEVSEMLNFQPYRESRAPGWEMTTKRSNFECRSPLLSSTDSGSRSLTMKEKVLTAFKPSSLPAAVFIILSSVPKLALIGQPIPLFVGIQYDPSRSTARERPVVELKSFNVRLVGLTGLRGQVENYHGTKYLPSSHSSWTKGADLANLSKSLPMEDIMDMREHMDLTVPSSYCPSFSTFNVAREYTLKIEITIECAKEKCKTNLEISPFVLLASHPSDSTTPPRIGGLESLRAEEGNGDVLPTWEESGGDKNMVIVAEKEDAPPDYEPAQYA